MPAALHRLIQRGLQPLEKSSLLQSGLSVCQSCGILQHIQIHIDGLNPVSLPGIVVCLIQKPVAALLCHRKLCRPLVQLNLPAVKLHFLPGTIDSALEILQLAQPLAQIGHRCQRPAGQCRLQPGHTVGKAHIYLAGASLRVNARIFFRNLRIIRIYIPGIHPLAELPLGPLLCHNNLTMIVR